MSTNQSSVCIPCTHHRDYHLVFSGQNHLRRVCYFSLNPSDICTLTKRWNTDCSSKYCDVVAFPLVWLYFSKRGRTESTKTQVGHGAFTHKTARQTSYSRVMVDRLLVHDAVICTCHKTISVIRSSNHRISVRGHSNTSFLSDGCQAEQNQRHATGSQNNVLFCEICPLTQLVPSFPVERKHRRKT